MFAYPRDPVADLRDLRDNIDNIDIAIVRLLAERFRCPDAMGKLKASAVCHFPIPEGKHSRSHVCGITPQSANSIQALPRSSLPLSAMN